MSFFVSLLESWRGSTVEFRKICDINTYTWGTEKVQAVNRMSRFFITTFLSRNSQDGDAHNLWHVVKSSERMRIALCVL